MQKLNLSAALTTLNLCDCFKLTRDDFDDVLKAFPDQREPLLLAIKETLASKAKVNKCVMSNHLAHPKLRQIAPFRMEKKAEVPRSDPWCKWRRCARGGHSPDRNPKNGRNQFSSWEILGMDLGRELRIFG